MTTVDIATQRRNDTVRVAAVQYELRALHHASVFEDRVSYFVGVAAEAGADFVTFPELFTLELLSAEPDILSAEESITRLTEYTPRLTKLLQDLATRHRINIIGGSHLLRDHHRLTRNVCLIATRDGTLHTRQKIHPTPNERRFWNVKGSDELDVIETDCGPVGVLICYDAEFPELARRLADQGAMFLFVPFCTDERRGYLRVRYCAQARAIENQVYVVLSGVTGNLTGVANMDLHYAQSCILTPCDLAFARDGIAAEADPNIATIVFADLHVSALETARQSGATQNFHDRRTDLYNVRWQGRPASR